MIPTVQEKPVKSIGRLYEIFTDRSQHRVKDVQKVALDGFKSIDRTHLPDQLKAWFSAPASVAVADVY